MIFESLSIVHNNEMLFRVSLTLTMCTCSAPCLVSRLSDASVRSSRFVAFQGDRGTPGHSHGALPFSF